MRTRRVVLFGLGAAGAGAAAGMYRVSPSFWRSLPGEIRRPVLPPPNVPSPKSWPDRGLHAAWLGHSTVLMKVEGFTILTDPVFSSHAGFHFGPVALGLKRLIAPAVAMMELPPVDLIVVSHAHMDHLDTPSLKQLESGSTRVVTARATSDLLRVDRYQRVDELSWGQAIQVGPVEVTALEVNHWGARYRTDTHRGYNGYLIQSGKYRILFAGDTAQTDAFRQIRMSRDIDFGIMPIGAYNPWIRYHCNPEQAWRMADDAGVDHRMPVHHQTFALGREPKLEPIERFLTAARSHQRRVVTRAIGQEFHLA